MYIPTKPVVEFGGRNRGVTLRVNKAVVWLVGVALCLLGFACAPAMSQVIPTSELAGTVVDPSGSAMPGASVRLTNTGTQLTKETRTDSLGRFLFTLMPPGQYELTVTASGFSTYSRSGIILNANTTANVNVKLALGATKQQITVQANAQMIQTQSGALGQIVGRTYIEQLPLNGRNAAQLVFMAPGSVTGVGQTTATYANTSEALPISVNGTYGDQVSYKLDGATHQDSVSNLNATFPDPDAIAEFSVQTNNFDARYGGAAGAVVDIVTKSGTNGFHGSLFEFLRNGALNARNFFSPLQDSLKRNQFGGTLGGPIRHDKLFLFGSYQGTIVRNRSLTSVAFVPSAAMRSGDFSSLSKAIVDPGTGKRFPGNKIPPSMISPIAQQILAKAPSTTNPTGELLYAPPIQQDANQAFGKINYNAQRNMLSGSFFYVRYHDPGWNADQTLLDYHLGQLQTTREFNVNDTYTLTPNLMNTAVFDALLLNSGQTRTAPFSIFDFGEINVAKPAQEFQETQISVTGFGGWGGGGPAPPGQWLRSNYEVSDMLSYIRGSHSMFLGIELTPRTRFDSRTGFQEEPTFSFTGQATGNPLADLLLGDVAAMTQTAGKTKFTRATEFNAFFQDNWRATRYLTLNLGLRWEPYLSADDHMDRQVGGYIPGFRSTRFPNAPVGLAFAGDPGFPNGGFHTNVGNLAPRFGFAWEVGHGSHPTTIHGGWGAFFIQPLIRDYNNFVENAPFSPSVQLTGVSLSDPYGSAGVESPFPPFAPVHAGPTTTFVLPVKYAFFDPNFRLGHLEAWNLTVEHQLAPNLLARAGYVGDRGVHLPFDEELNPAIYRPGATLKNTDQRRHLYPDFSSLQELTNHGTSNYNAFQFSVEKRMSRQFSLVANYTFSKSLDNESIDNQFQLAAPNPFDRESNYGLSGFETPHNFSLWGLWNLPRLENHSPVVRSLLGDWGLRGVWTWRSGTPFSVISGQDRSLSGVRLDRADLIGNPLLSSGRPRSEVISEYFNTSAFTLNALGTFGTAPRNLLWNVRAFNIDFGLEKSFPITERIRGELRGEFFNFFNNVHLNQPGDNVSSTSTFAKITSAGDPRIVQLALRFEF